MAQTKLALLKKIGFILAPSLFLLMLLLPAPQGLEPAAWRTAAVGVLMAIMWVTEPIPIPATSLLPLLLFPLLGISPVKEAAAPFANPLIFLFMGGFIIALGMQRWNLHRRIALTIISAVGMHPRAIIAGFMLATALLSMWVSNTATTLMMLPIAASVIELTEHDSKKARDNFSVALLLGLAYSASIGGLGTIVGTPPNALLAGFVQQTYNITIGFAQWMMLGVPLVLIGLPISYVVLTVLVFPIKKQSTNNSGDFIKTELEKIGNITVPEKRIAAIFVFTALFWITRPLLSSFIPGLTDTGIAIFGALLAFFVPSGRFKAEFLLDWKTAEKLPWGILLLFGGGLSLAGAISSTGLSSWIGTQLTVLQAAPVWVIVLAATGVIILLTELTSNTATAAAFLPIMASLAISMGQKPLLLLIPAAVAASCAFMLPVATPPNAIIYGSDRVNIVDMVRAGITLNIVFALLITLLTFLLVPSVFRLQIGG